jgi:hypothetical protein
MPYALPCGLVAGNGIGFTEEPFHQKAWFAAGFSQSAKYPHTEPALLIE